MHKHKILLVLLLVFLLTGCNSNEEVTKLESQVADLEKELKEVKGELEKSELSNSELEKELTDAENEILRLANEIANMQVGNPNYELEILSAGDNRLLYIIKEINEISQTISIVGYNNDEITEEFGEITIDGTGHGELFKIKVIGSIFNFELVQLFWNENTNELEEGNVIKKIDEVRNQNIVISTVIPEGIPLEKIKWKDPDGNEYEYFISYDGYGFNGTIIWNK